MVVETAIRLVFILVLFERRVLQLHAYLNTLFDHNIHSVFCPLVLHASIRTLPAGMYVQSYGCNFSIRSDVYALLTLPMAQHREKDVLRMFQRIM